MRLLYVSFFMFIRLHFGYQTCQLLKNFIRLTKRCVKLRIRVKFLKTCISCGFIPSHLNLTKYYDSIQFYNNDSRKRLESILYNHVKAILRLELRDTYNYMTLKKKFLNFIKSFQVVYLFMLETRFLANKKEIMVFIGMRRS